jgi:hypothetical protein
MSILFRSNVKEDRNHLVTGPAIYINHAAKFTHFGGELSIAALVAVTAAGEIFELDFDDAILV